jgi:ubiquinone/menaquinone biosynthesis C-methylase UbiE
MSSANSKTVSQQRYTMFGQSYVTSKGHAEGEELDRLVELADPQPDWVMLDIATGGGHTALRLAPHVARVVATDITPEMLVRAEAFITGQGVGNIAFRRADAEDLPFDENSFDLVTCRIAPHHFPDCPRFVQEVSRVLKSGGLFLVQDHAMPEDEQAARYVDAFEKLRDPSHNRGFSETEWIEMFQAAGLAVEHTEQIVKKHRLLPWAERQGCTQDIINRLVLMVEEAPDRVTAWMQPRDFGTPGAEFVNHHVIIAGRKGQSTIRNRE